MPPLSENRLIVKAQVFTDTPVTSGNSLHGAAITPSLEASCFRITLGLNAGANANLSVTVDDSSIQDSYQFPTEITAGQLFTFTHSVYDANTYTYTLDQDTVDYYLVIEEVSGGVI